MSFMRDKIMEERIKLRSIHIPKQQNTELGQKSFLMYIATVL